MRPTEPLPLYHSWPLFERDRRFASGAELNSPFEMPLDPVDLTRSNEALVARGIGLWHCDLRNESLTWSDGVYDLFGLPRGARVRRREAVAIYTDDSGAVMEKLRGYALKHRRGFTLDAQIRPFGQRARWMRLLAAPIYENGRPVRLCGLKIGI
jgi:PAS domain-containing protein